MIQQGEYKNSYRWMILGVLFFSQVALSLGAYAWGPLGPYIKKSLSLNPVQFGSLTSMLYMVSVVCSIPSGISVDRFGVRINLFLCMMLMGIALISASFTHDYIYLVIIIAFVGASYGMINPVASKGLTLWFDTKSRATAFGFRQMGVTAGGAIAGILLIYLAQLRDWNLAILVVGIISVVIGISGFFLYKESPDKENAGCATAKGHSKNIAIIDLVKNRNFLLTCLIMTLLCLGQSSIGAFLVLYLEEELGFPPLLAGSFLTITMICGGTARVFWGIVSDRVFNGRRLPVMKLVCGIATLGALVSFFWVSGLSSSFYLPVVVFFGFSYLGFQGVAVVLLVEVCGPELAGRATGLGVTIAWMGMVLGPVIFGAIVPSGYNWAWLFIAITSLSSVVLCYIINED